MLDINTGLFIISLDFELMWGVRDKRTIENYGANIKGVRRVIPSLLQLFEQHDICATFATVGLLFARGKEELMGHLPAERPQYTHGLYSPYENGYLQSIGATEAEDVYHFGHSLVEQIKKHPGQELATHTFSHYYCLEGASLSSFEADLIAAKAIAGAKGVQLRSIVFPRNQYSSEHLEICHRQGLIAYRGNETSTIYKPRANEEQSSLIRATRLMDSYVNLTGHHTFKPDHSPKLVNLPASRFLRPYSAKLKTLEKLRLQRIKQSMTYAAKKGEAFHLWWHPHNFGINLKENLAFLEVILKHYQWLHNTQNMQSKTMGTVAEEILQTNAI